MSSPPQRPDNVGRDWPQSVRHPTRDDAEDVGETHSAAWEEGYSALFDPGVLEELVGVRRTMWTRILADPEFDLEGMLVVESDGRVVGYSHFGSSEEDETQGEVFGSMPTPGSGALACRPR